MTQEVQIIHTKLTSLTCKSIAGVYRAFTTPHKLKAVAGDTPVLMLPVIMIQVETMEQTA